MAVVVQNETSRRADAVRSRGSRARLLLAALARRARRAAAGRSNGGRAGAELRGCVGGTGALPIRRSTDRVTTCGRRRSSGHARRRRRALELDSANQLAHFTLARLAFFARDRSALRAATDRLIALNPLAHARHLVSRHGHRLRRRLGCRAGVLRTGDGAEPASLRHLPDAFRDRSLSPARLCRRARDPRSHQHARLSDDADGARGHLRATRTPGRGAGRLARGRDARARATRRAFTTS